MKVVLRVLLIAAVVVAAVTGLVFSYLEMRKERDLEATAETPVVGQSRLERDAAGGPVLQLDKATETLLGLRTALPAPGSVRTELTAPARVLDGGGLAQQLNELYSAQAALPAALADRDRKKSLFENGNIASALAVEQAAVLAKQQELLVEAGRSRITATWGDVLARREDLESFAQRLLARELALVRVDLLPSETLTAIPTEVRLSRISGPTLTTARVLGPAPLTDLSFAGQSLLCLVSTNATPLVPGARLLGHIITGTTVPGTILPHSAIVRHAGLGWAYVQTAPQRFSRRVAPLDHPHPDGWLQAGDWSQPVVVSGAQTLLSEELKGSIQMTD